MATTEKKTPLDPEDLRSHERDLILAFVAAKTAKKSAEAEIEYLAPQVTVLLTVKGQDVLTKSGARVAIANGPSSTVYSAAVTEAEAKLKTLKEEEVAKQIAQVVPSSLKVARVYITKDGQEVEA